MDRKSKTQINNCNAPKGSRQIQDDNKWVSALSGVTHHDGYNGKINDIWHRKDDEKLFLDWLNEIKKYRSLIKNRQNHMKVAKPYVVTHHCVVELIFKMCKDLNQPADTRYRTVELFDRYVANQFIDFLKVVGKKKDLLAEWNKSLPKISNQALLRVTSCIQLASKYCAQCTIVSPKRAHSYLTKRGQTLEIQNVISSEMRVFKSLDYDIGVPTLLVFVDVLLHLIREMIEDKIYTVCISMVDIIYLQRQELFKKLGEKLLAKWAQTLPKKFPCNSYEFDGLYCGAACITSAVKVYYPNDMKLVSGVTKKLSKYIEKPEADIVAFASLILQMVGV